MTRCHRASGHTLAGTLVFLVLLLILWAGVHQQTASCLRIEKTCCLRQERAVGGTRALAWALALLETGNPPFSPYSCRAGLPSPAGAYVLTFTKAGQAVTVAVRPATAEDIYLPEAPDHFDKHVPPGHRQGLTNDSW